MRWLDSRVGFGLLAALYLLSFPYHPALRSPNELCRAWAARAIVDFHQLSINGVLQTMGGVGDLACTTTVEVGGEEKLLPCVGPDAPPPPGAVVKARHYYSSKAPLVAFLGAPVYWGLSRFGPVSELSQIFWSRLFVNILPTLLMLVALRRFLRAQLTPELADLLTVTYGLGTMAFSYSEAFMSHQLTAVLLFGAFYAAWRVEKGEWKPSGYLLAGALAGAAVMAEYTAALGVVCVASYTVAARWRRWGALAVAAGLVVAGSLPLLGALMAYHQACFGGPLLSGYKFLNDANYQGWHQGGFLGIKLPDAQAFALSLVSPLRGLFTLSPFLALALWGLKELRRVDRAQFAFLVVLLVGNAYFTSSFAYSSWGWTVGPRHLTPLVPFLLVPAGLTLNRLRSSEHLLGFSLAAGLCVTSVLAMGVVAFTNYIPDDVSTSLWGLALPLLADGFYPVSALVGWVANPASGLVLIALLGAVTVWLAQRFVALRAVWAILGVVVVAHFGALRLFTRNDAGDLNAQKFMKGVWLAPSGVRVDFGAPQR